MVDKTEITSGHPTNPARAYWKEKEVATRLNMTVKWLQKKRLEGDGIPYTKFGSAVRYAIADVIRFEADAARSSTSDNGGGL